MMKLPKLGKTENMRSKKGERASSKKEAMVAYLNQIKFPMKRENQRVMTHPPTVQDPPLATA